MRLIDADDYKKNIIEAINEQFRKGNMTGALWLTYSDCLLDEQPSIDAVQVVRCKDCICYERGAEGEEWGFCHRAEVKMPQMGFCSDAERREEQ